ncbi:MAG TPA: aromatic ring-hydroxylating dioxygenase subunit alpha [Thermoplasmata archaeon]|nr:aromatic ring-hydroxylating dioxygenase subunit alpha [Thermoplasmata archaeon]
MAPGQRKASVVEQSRRRAALRAVDRPLRRAATLPGSLFSDAEVFAHETRKLIQRSWTCVGREDEIPNAGDLRTYEIGGSGVIVVRDDDGHLRAFHNVCRHRGTRLVEGASASGVTVLQCPYHAWTYDRTGGLVGAPHMDEAEGFAREEHGLYPVPTEVWRGFLFLNLDSRARPLKESLGRFAERVAPYPLERLRRAHRVVYEIAANWKLVVQNANECYHCPGVHPQLVRLTPYRSGEEDLRKGPVFGGWMDFVDGARTLSPGGTTARQTFPGLSAEDLRRVYYYVLYPNNFLSLLPDYVTLDWFIPLSPERTRLMFDLYVDRDEPDPAADAMDFWDTTNRQDWHICELAHLGSKTIAYRQGRYSSEEEVVHLIDRYYLRRMGFLNDGRGRTT